MSTSPGLVDSTGELFLMERLGDSTLACGLLLLLLLEEEIFSRSFLTFAGTIKIKIKN